MVRQGFSYGSQLGKCPERRHRGGRKFSGAMTIFVMEGRGQYEAGRFRLAKPPPRRV
jgi:hypothetical protein